MEVEIQEKLLAPNDWRKLQQTHSLMLEPILKPYLERRSRQVKQPVMDFLFEYYSFRPAQLLRWSPGVGVRLAMDGGSLPEISELTVGHEEAWLDRASIPLKKQKSLAWIGELLHQTEEKPPVFSCFGMHEWAMVYRSQDVRHEQLPLRLSPDAVAAFVESRPLACTHFDAFRFFTEEARPLNRYELSRERFAEMEQPGCIHSNMDLYKWAYKGYPWVSSEVIRDAFLLAVEARHVDMQASPYDMRGVGLRAIAIETEEGRREYVERQHAIWVRGREVRRRLIEELEQVLGESADLR
ncbi:MAG: 3-methyladenine DNA glycosylase [Bacteroidetes bacterium]|jgi:hypothetical protein|nr:MAG: 3-methyladenine DNA glycosylase [Bacteroidota bacterium]